MKYNLTPYNQFIAKSRYARFLDEENRRENWDETVSRYFNFMSEHLLENYNFNMEGELRTKLQNSVQNLEVMPSMRCLMTAGEALKRSNIAAFNCAYIVIDDVKAFDEAMLILMNGTGIGFSVENKYIAKLSEIPDSLFQSETTIVVSDSKAGWSKAFRQLLALLYSGEIPKWDISKVRKAGARLKTFGGRASGPEPLVELFEFCIGKFKNAIGRKLTSSECHDIMCKIGEVVVVGGVRRCLLGTDEGLMNNGSKKIKDIKVGDEVLTDYGFKKVIASKNVGIKKVYKIKTNIGNLYSTLEHRWATLKNIDGTYEWKETKNLTSKDILIFNDKKIEGFYQDFPQQEGLNLPKLDPEIAWFLGYFLGNGSCSTRIRKEGWMDNKFRVSYPLDRNNLKERVVNNFNKFVDSYSISIKNGSEEIVNSQKLISNYFLEYIKKPNINIIIPTWIKTNTIEIKESFLAGVLDSDGTVRNRITEDQIGTGIINICSTKYESFQRQLHSLCASLGIPTKMQVKIRNGKSNEYILKTIGSRYTLEFINTVGKYSNKIKYDYEYIKNSKDMNSLSIDKIHISSSRSKFDNYKITEFNYKKVIGKELPIIPIRVECVDYSHNEEVYDIQVEDRECFYVNGILTHNSAMISLSDLSDDKMANAKIGNWWETQPQRALANNSAVYNEKPTIGKFMTEWLSLYNSKSGERGIYNRQASINQVEKYGIRDSNYDFGVNPCSEIILRPNEFCNLTTCIIREDDTEEKIINKIEIASILGTFQATLTDFPYLRKIWKKNTEEEALLGVSMTGILDNKLLNNINDEELPNRLSKLRLKARETNKEYSDLLNIPISAAITAIKPEGTTSSLCNTASGLHPQYSKYYIRTVRADNKDPLTQFMKEKGFKNEPCVMKPEHTTIFSFPLKSPENAITRDDLSSIEHLNLWLIYQRHYCEHKPSITINIKESDWIKVGAWVYDNFDELTGVSFLPYDVGSYKQAPFQKCNEEEYNNLLKITPDYINWNDLIEHEDNVEGVQMLSCSAGVCEI